MQNDRQRQLALAHYEGRGPIRRLLEVRGAVGGHRAPYHEVELTAADGVRLRASWLRGPGPQAPAIVIAHGFAAHRRKPSYALLADHLSEFGHVLSLDLRGHGGSGGRCTFGDLEALDVRAGVDWLRAAGRRSVAAVGVSMGAAAVLHALAEGLEVDAAVTISGQAQLGEPETPPLQRLDRIWRTWWRRLGMRVVTGVRVVPPHSWAPYPHPRDLARKVKAPWLIVHGLDDHFFPLGHAKTLHACSAGPATLWVERDFGHAEEGLTPDFSITLGRAVKEALRRGRFPERERIAP
ncbi:MAG: alpha/beta fold hydrolase [Actinomycetota bacterium]|nr:alpha/beta fold hydrolase [Actinomycetota bacterium]